MKAISSMAIYCFSGTGNTLRLARRYSDELAKRGVAAKLVLLPCEVPCKIENPITLMFPVYAQSAPPFVLRWISSLPQAGGIPASVVTTLAGCSGFVNAPLRRILLAKGFVPYSIAEIRMPSNYISQRVRPENEFVVAKAEERIAKFAGEVADGSARWRGGIPFSPALQKLSTAFFAKIASGLGRKFHADGYLCTRCGLCARLCPVSNIVIPKDGSSPLPSWGGGCEQCLRCMNFCPHGAVKTKSRIFAFIYRPKYVCGGTRADDFLGDER